MFYVPDRVDFTTSQVRMPKLSEATLITHNKQMSPKRPQELRQKAILNHAYSNPQCNMSNGLYICNHKLVSRGLSGKFQPELGIEQVSLGFEVKVGNNDGLQLVQVLV